MLTRSCHSITRQLHYMMMGLNGIFAIMAALGGLMFIAVVVGSVFFGRKLAKDEKPIVPRGSAWQAAAVSAAMATRGSLKIPGTAMLVGYLLHRIRSVLLRELEVPVRSLAAELGK